LELTGILDFGRRGDDLHICLKKLREDRWQLNLAGETDQQIQLEAQSQVTALTGNKSLDRFLPKPLSRPALAYNRALTIPAIDQSTKWKHFR
jgi:hypothetical protein